MPIAELGKKRIWYQINGHGKPLFQLHGAGLGHQNFARVTPVLSQHFQVIDIDMVGYGESSPVPHGYTLQNWADDLKNLMDLLEIPEANIHGTAGGGFISILFAARYPERVSKLVLVGTIARYDKAGRLYRKLTSQIAQHISMEAAAEMTALSVLTRDFLDSPEAESLLEHMTRSFRSLPIESYLRMNEATEIVDLGPELIRISAPTLVIVGENSQITPVDSGASGIGARGIANGVQNGSLLVMPNCGHLVLMEKFEEVCQAIIEFINQ